MDEQSFDRLAVAVDRIRDRSTRRGALRALLGGSLAAAVAVLAPAATDAACTSLGFRCRRNGDCCSGRCASNTCIPNTGGGCRSTGFGCGNDSDCCSGNCERSICVSGGGSCNSLGFGCRLNGDCCSGRCSGNICVRDGDGGRCGPGLFACGSGAGRGCCPVNFRCCRGGFGSGCCPSGFRCRSNGTCTLGGGVREASASGEERVVPKTERVEATETDREGSESTARRRRG